MVIAKNKSNISICRFLINIFHSKMQCACVTATFCVVYVILLCVEYLLDMPDLLLLSTQRNLFSE